MELAGCFHLRAEFRVLGRGAAIFRNVGDAVRLVSGVREGVATAGRVRAASTPMLVESGLEGLDDLVLLLQLLTEPA